MKARLTQLSYRLQSGELISLDHGSGWELSCHTGRIWLTVAGDARDVWLQASQSFQITANSKVLIEAANTLGSEQAVELSLSFPGHPGRLPISAAQPASIRQTPIHRVFSLQRLRSVWQRLSGARATQACRDFA